MYFARRPSWSSGPSGVRTRWALGSHAESMDFIAELKSSRAFGLSFAGVMLRGAVAWAKESGAMERGARAIVSAMALENGRSMRFPFLEGGSA